MQWAEEKERPG